MVTRTTGVIAAMPLTWLLACDPGPVEPDPVPWPQTPQCEGLAAWPVEWADLERDALTLIDDLRQQGADCGERGKYGPAPSLTRHPALDCAARVHAQDMATMGYIGSLDPDGRSEVERVADAGYSAQALVQHIAVGPVDAEELIERTWLPRPVPCSSMISMDFTEIGMGLYTVADPEPDQRATHWVMVLSKP